MDNRGGRSGPPPARRPDRRAPEPEPKGGKVGYAVLAVGCIAAIIAAVMLAKTILKPGGATNNKAVPTLIGLQQKDLTALLAKAENSGFSLAGNGQDCGTQDRTQMPAGQVISQNPENGTYVTPGAITYCVATGPKLGAIGNWKNQPQTTVIAELKKNGFNVDNIVVNSVPSKDVPKDAVIDIIDLTTQKSLLGQNNLDTSKVVPTLTVSSGQALITLPTNLIGIDANQAKTQLNNAGFTNVTIGVDSSATPTTGTPNLVTKVSPASGQLSADTPIELFTAPVAPTTPQSTACNPQTDGNGCVAPTTSTTTPGNTLGGLFPTSPQTHG